MNPAAKPIPSKHFQQRQRKLQRLLDLPGSALRTSVLNLKEQLEAEFVHAWGFSHDTDDQALEMKMMAARNCGTLDHSFDHCTCYLEPQTGSHIVVTQPYHEPGEVLESLTRSLMATNSLKPELIPAPDWAFYYPGHATLLIVKFPPGYESILKALDRLWSPAAEWSLRHN